MQLFKRILLQIFGYSFMAFGIAMIIRSNQGSFPYDAISFYLSELIPIDFLTIGVASILIGITWSILNFIILKKLKVFLSLIIVFTIGYLIDLFYYIVLGSYDASNTIMNIMVAVVGLIIVCFSVGIIVLNKSLPGAPSETTLVYLQTKIKSNWAPKLIIEGSLALIAFVLGLIYGDLFQLGWFTLLCVFGCGPMINLFSRLFKNVIGEY